MYAKGTFYIKVEGETVWVRAGEVIPHVLEDEIRAQVSNPDLVDGLEASAPTSKPGVTLPPRAGAGAGLSEWSKAAQELGIETNGRTRGEIIEAVDKKLGN